MDVVSELHEALHPLVIEALPYGLRTRLELALSRCKRNTLHSYRSWINERP
jgi:hypothetical protein